MFGGVCILCTVKIWLFLFPMILPDQPQRQQLLYPSIFGNWSHIQSHSQTTVTLVSIQFVAFNTSCVIYCFNFCNSLRHPQGFLSDASRHPSWSFEVHELTLPQWCFRWSPGQGYIVSAKRTAVPFPRALMINRFIKHMPLTSLNFSRVTFW